MAGPIEYDTLKIKISADSQEANKSVEHLKDSLKTLDDTAKNLDVKQITQVQKILQDIASVNFDNVSKGLQSVVSAFKQLNKTSGSGKPRKTNSVLSGEIDKPNIEPPKVESYIPNFKMLSDVYDGMAKLTDFKPNFSLIGDVYDDVIMLPAVIEEVKEKLHTVGITLSEVAKGFENVFDQAKRTLEISEAYDNVVSTLQEAGYSLAEIERALGQIATEDINVEEYERLKQSLTDTGISAKDAERLISKLNKTIGSGEDSANKGRTALGKWLKRAKEIAKYRIIRKFIQEIYKALIEGIQGVAMFDDATNNAMSEIKSSFDYLKNSIGALLAPFIQLVAPFISTLNDTLGDLANNFAEVFSAMNGQTQFAQATKEVKDYRAELKKTQSIGIDELNVLNPENKGFEMVDIDYTKDGMEGIKGIFTEISKLLKDFVKLGKPFLDNIIKPILGLLKPIFEIVTQIADIFMIAIQDTMGDVNQSIYDFVGMLTQIFTFISNIVTDLSPTIVQAIHIVGSVLNMINSCLGGIFKVVGGIFTALSPIANFISTVILPLVNVVLTIVTTIFKVVEGIVKSLVAIITFDWGNLGNIWTQVGEDIAKAWADMGNGNAKIYGNFAGTYALGGFPEDGIFYANSTELIGRFEDGRTAVANNEQITQGIYEAVRQAMKETGGGKVSIQIDGHELAKIIKKEQDNFGTNDFVGGNLNWGV